MADNRTLKRMRKHGKKYGYVFAFDPTWKRKFLYMNGADSILEEQRFLDWAEAKHVPIFLYNVHKFKDHEAHANQAMREEQEERSAALRESTLRDRERWMVDNTPPKYWHYMDRDARLFPYRKERLPLNPNPRPKKRAKFEHLDREELITQLVRATEEVRVYEQQHYNELASYAAAVCFDPVDMEIEAQMLFEDTLFPDEL